MDITQFAIWRFRNAEGVMKYIKSWNGTECVLDVKGKIVKITYDLKNETISIQDKLSPFAQPIVVRFDEFVPTMKKLDYYELRPDSERHSLSYQPENT